MKKYFTPQKPYLKYKHALLTKSSTKTTPKPHTNPIHSRKIPFFQILQIQPKIDCFQNLKLLTPAVKNHQTASDHLQNNSTYQARNGFKEKRTMAEINI